MRTLAIVLVGVVADLSVAGVDWSREAIGQDRTPDAVP